MSETWNANDDPVETTPVNSISVGNYSETVEGEVDSEKVKEVAREQGVKNFKVETPSGAGLDQAQFPYDGDVVVKEYNENA